MTAALRAGVRSLCCTLLLALLCGFFPFPGFTAPQPVATLTLTSILGVGPSGGNITVRGTGFERPSFQYKSAGSSAGPWNMCGASTPCTVISSSSSQIIVNLPATSAGDYDVLVSNQGGAWVYSAALLTVTATFDPGTIGGANLVLWYRATDDTNTGNGTPTTAVVDKSGVSPSNAPTSITGVTHNSSSANFNNQPTWSFDGSTSAFLVSNVNLVTGNTIHCALAMRLGAAGTNPTFWGYARSGQAASILKANVSTGIPTVGDNISAVWSSSVVGTPVNVEGYIQKLTSTTVSIGVAVNGQTLVTNSGTGTTPATTTDLASFGASINSSGAIVAPFAQIEVAEIACFNALLNGTQRAQLASYYNLRYALAPAPTYTASTNVASTSAGAQSWRVSGANFVSGMAANVSHSNVNVGTTTTTVLSSTLAEMSLPGATYTAQLDDLDLLNPDGGEQTTLGAINITSTLDVMQIGGNACIGWWTGDNVTPSSGNIGTWLDGSLRGNPIASNTATVYTAIDATFSNHGSGTLDGATSFGTIASLLGVAAADPLFMGVIFKLGAQTANAIFLDYGGTSELRFDQSVAGHPAINFGGVHTQWGSALTTAGVHFCYVYETGGSTWTQAVNCDSGSTGTEVTATVTNTAISAAATFFDGKRSGGNFVSAKFAEFFVCRGSAMSSTQISNFHTYAQTKGAP